MRRRYFIGFFLVGGFAGFLGRRLLGSISGPISGQIASQIKGDLKRARYYRRLER